MKGSVANLFELGGSDIFFFTPAQLKNAKESLMDGYSSAALKANAPSRPYQAFAKVREPWNKKYCYYGYITTFNEGTPGGYTIPYKFKEEVKEIEVRKADPQEISLDKMVLYGALLSPLATTGWDPEFFVESGKGELIPAFEFLPEKTSPLENNKGPQGFYHLYADGFAGEFTTCAATCHGYGVDTIRNGLDAILDEAKIKFPRRAVRISPKNFMHLTPKMLASGTDSQVALGCVPSLNAYDLDPLNLGDARSLPFRSAGGHIHFGVLNNLKKKGSYANWIKTLDQFLALPCVALFDGIDNPMRRTMYGRAGEYRECPYGFEYRVLSNAWMLTPEIAHLVLNLARGVGRAYKAMGTDILKLPEGEVQEIVNVCDGPKARKFVEDNWKTVSLIGQSDLGPVFDKSKKLFLDGLGAVIPEWDNIEKNWHLGDSWMGHSHNSQCTFNYLSLSKKLVDGRVVKL